MFFFVCCFFAVFVVDKRVSNLDFIGREKNYTITSDYNGLKKQEDMDWMVILIFLLCVSEMFFLICLFFETKHEFSYVDFFVSFCVIFSKFQITRKNIPVSIFF